jgi:uncharacterized sulfatase
MWNANLSRRGFLAGAAAGSAAAQRAALRRPNILFLYTDDQAAWTLGGAGNRDASTPHIDRLAAEGATFRNSFVTTPVCSPSRAGLIASRYGTEVGITDYLQPAGEDAARGLDTRFAAWPRVFQAAGYRTGLIGKWHLGIQPGFHPSKHGYGHTTIFSQGEGGPADPVFEIGGQSRKIPGYTVDIVTNLALDFVRERKNEPFMLSVHYREPHASNAPGATGRDRTWLPVPDQDWLPFREKDVSIPNPDYPNLDTPRLRRMMREYHASVSSIDRNVGRLLKALTDQGIERDTIVVFTSDNGMNMGHNGIWHKGNGRWILRDNQGYRPNMYDHSLRVPAVVRWPGRVRPGSRIEQTFTNLDWFPTLLSMAGLALPRGAVIHGRDAWPLLAGKRAAWQDGFYGEYRLYHGASANLRMWRTPDWKLVRDFENPGNDEMYDLRSDPAETRNRIRSADAKARRALAALRASLNARLSSLGDPLAGKA